MMLLGSTGVADLQLRVWGKNIPESSASSAVFL